jgi:hypothetical protein
MNNNNQQTVVHWLQEALEGTILTHDQTMQVIGLFMQADEMFKEQIIDTFVEGMRCQNFDPNKGRAEIYYNETFNQQP